MNELCIMTIEASAVMFHTAVPATATRHWLHENTIGNKSTDSVIKASIYIGWSQIKATGKKGINKRPITCTISGKICSEWVIVVNEPRQSVKVLESR